MASFDKDSAIAHLRANARQTSAGQCGVYVRKAIAAGGIELARQGSACNYGSSLESAGFRSLGSSTSGFRAGDVVVINCAPAHPHGHISMYDGTQWISDYNQNSLSVYRDMPYYTVYRYGD